MPSLLLSEISTTFFIYPPSCHHQSLSHFRRLASRCGGYLTVSGPDAAVVVVVEGEERRGVEVCDVVFFCGRVYNVQLDAEMGRHLVAVSALDYLVNCT